MMDGFREGYRVLRPGGHAVYNISIVGDHTSENTKNGNIYTANWMKAIPCMKNSTI